MAQAEGCSHCHAFCLGHFAFSAIFNVKEANRTMHTKINAVTERIRKKVQDVNVGRALYTAFLIPTAVAATPLQAHAAGDTIWTKASEIMQDVYTQILGISTIAAIVTASIALLLMNFSRSGRTVDESRAWLKRIIITWAILNGLGFIMAYVTPFFSGGTWSPTTT